MDVTVDELIRLADERSQLKIKMSDLERENARLKEENVQMKHQLAGLMMEKTATQIENMYLKNYITLSAERIKVFVRKLKSVDRFAFLKSFVEWSLPKEHYVEQLKRVNELMEMPDERLQITASNHYVTMTGAEATYMETNNSTGKEENNNGTQDYDDGQECPVFGASGR